MSLPESAINLNPEVVRDMLLDFFVEAHSIYIKNILDTLFLTSKKLTEKEKNKIAQEHSKKIVKRAFVDTGGDFQKPTKEDLIRVLNYLRIFAKPFRSQMYIDMQYENFKTLIQSL